MESTTLDGNAIAGLLAQVFGQDMTTAVTKCASCDRACQVAELVVFTRAPGTVVRCTGCRAVQMVLVTIREITCVDLRGVAALDRDAMR